MVVNTSPGLKMDFHEYFKVNYSNKSGSDLEAQDDKGCDVSDCTSNTTMETEHAHMHSGSAGDETTLYNEYFTAAEAATERVAELINDDFECKDLFCQMDVLRVYKEDLVWKEMARWIRYEEAVEEGGQRWSKPHVASLMMEALQDLQNMLSACPVMLNSTCMSMLDVADEATTAWVKNGDCPPALKNKLCNVLTKQHKFQHYEKKKKHGTSTNLQKFFQGGSEVHINKAFENGHDHLGLERSIPRVASFAESPSLAMGEMNKNFMRKIPPGSEVVNLFVGEVEELDKICAAFVRLKEAGNIGDITEVDLNTRFVFIVLGPKSHLGHCAEMTRCMAALFTDELFRIVAFRAERRSDILAGVQEFSLHLTVLPPGVWNPTTRIEPPDEIPSQDYRKTATTTTLTTSKSMVSMVDMDKGGDEGGNDDEGHGDPTLVRTGRLFGGLIEDVKRKVPFLPSDFKDALHIQCVASFFFLFLATLTPNVTFGGLLSQATDNYMGTMECILAASISGIMFALFAGQPLNILGSTGPMLVLEGILYRFCDDQDWDFMPFRVWVGFWTGLFILLIVAFDLSALVRYITRFTEESFACLIALIFIFEAFKKTFEINQHSPVHFNPPQDAAGCFCMLNNGSISNFTTTETPFLLTTFPDVSTTSFSNSTNVTETTPKVVEHMSLFAKECMALGGTLAGGECDDKYVPDVFFFSLILFFCTFILATTLMNFRHGLFFPSVVRTNVSDFSVLISIIIMVLLDYAVGLPTPKLLVPEEFKPTKPGRPWFINPISEKNPWWLMLFSAVPAVLATILIFMDQQITAVIVNRRENKLNKGSGYHLDMAIVGVLVIILGILGLPWYVAATVTALAHVMSLKKVSECTAPGEKPVFLGVREQRVTALLVGIFSGLAVLITSVLKFIPMPVLYGVFLYMGVAPLGGMQLIQRVMIVFMPAKYQPDYSFVRNVPIKRVHLFTAIQVLCLAGLWVVKSVHDISIAFPLMVLIICFVRKALDYLFTQRELKWLDDILPATHVKPGEADTDSKDGGIKISISPCDDDSEVDRKFSTGKKANGKRPTRKSLAPRMSLTFDCKTDIDRIKAMTPEIITDRRKSLIMAVERKRSIASQDGDNRKLSSHSQFGRKLSCEAYSPHFSPLPLGGGPVSHEEHNKLNKMLSLPSAIRDDLD